MLRYASRHDSLLKALLFFFFLVFLLFIPRTLSLGVPEYVFDNIIAVFFMIFFFLLRRFFSLHPLTYFLVFVAFLLNSLGMFGFYNQSPLPIQWDHVDHFYGFFAVTFLLWPLFFDAFKKKNLFTASLFLLLAVLGTGVTIEYIEFVGFLVAGQGEGVLGQGLGDTQTEFGSSLWMNTMLDLIFNLLGNLVALMIILPLSARFPHKTYK